MNLKDLQEKIEAVWENRHLLSDEATMNAIDATFLSAKWKPKR